LYRFLRIFKLHALTRIVHMYTNNIQKNLERRATIIQAVNVSGSFLTAAALVVGFCSA